MMDATEQMERLRVIADYARARATALNECPDHPTDCYLACAHLGDQNVRIFRDADGWLIVAWDGKDAAGHHDPFRSWGTRDTVLALQEFGRWAEEMRGMEF
jgi:hypothetical protein